MGLQAIRDFWTWWADARDHILEHIHDGHGADWIEPLSERVAAIDSGLQWEFGPGRVAEHHLAVTAAGDPRLRVKAEQWRAMGPGADARIEFHCARQRMAADPMGACLSFGELEVDFALLGVEVEVDDTEQRFHLVCRHPALEQVDSEHHLRILLVLLDNLLGEDALETWVGRITSGEGPPEGEELSVLELRGLLDGVAQRWPEHNYVIARAVDPDTELPLIYMGISSAKYLRAPLFDTLGVARLPYVVGLEGMPTPEEKARVDAFDQVVEDQLQGQVQVMCRRTGAGERVVWMVLLGESGPGRMALEGLADAHPGHVELTFTWDPGWRGLPL